MSWNELPPHTRTHLEATLSERQQQVLILHLAGCGTRRIALMLTISRTTTRDHLATAISHMEAPCPSRSAASKPTSSAARTSSG